MFSTDDTATRDPQQLVGRCAASHKQCARAVEVCELVVESSCAIIRAMLRHLLLFFIPAFLVALLVVFLASRSTVRHTATGVVRDFETDAPLAGVALSAGAAHTTTNARGEYTMQFIRGQVAVFAIIEGYQPAQQELNGDDLAGRTYTLDFDLIPNHVAGYVLDAETNQTLPNAAVRVGESNFSTDARGAFQFRAVKKGTPISVTLSGYKTTTFTYNGQSPFNISLSPAGAMVTVMDAAGKPVPNAQVQGGDQAATTDTQGRATLRRLPTGTSIRVTAVGYETVTAPFSGADLQLTLRATSLDGVVTDAATGKPISNTLVYLGTTILTTNAQGAYHSDTYPAQGTLLFKAPGYRRGQVDIAGGGRRDAKLQPFQARGIHVPFGMTPQKIKEEFNLIKNTELNTIVVDVKSEKGFIAWESQMQLAKDIQATYLGGTHPRQVVENCRAGNVYCIARIPVFQDTRLANRRPDLALRYPDGRVFADNSESAWTNATNSAVWDYNLGLAKEVAAFGFDEIQFDYVRFPGTKADGLYVGALATEEGRVAAVTGFLARAQKELRPTGIFLSADVFGLTTAVDDDQRIGQRLRDLTPYLDYVSPMVYPDTWTEASYLLSRGLAIKNCTEANRCPYDVIFNSSKRAAEKTSVRVRPWLQAYPGKGNFGLAEFRLQKKAAEDAGSAGWLFWSAVGTYDAKIFGPPEKAGQ